jgi:hypothetical protein
MFATVASGCPKPLLHGACRILQNLLIDFKQEQCPPAALSRNTSRRSLGKELITTSAAKMPCSMPAAAVADAGSRNSRGL